MISVILCTHNPRADYFQRTLEALKAQTCPSDQWELLLVDNASEPALAPRCDLSWHPLARHLYEPELGLTPARLRGISEAKGNLLVFVDDDNVLATDYLSAADILFSRRRDLGVASGCILPEYETAPPAWFERYESWLAIRRIKINVWSNFFEPRSEPCGAGMCLRQEIALNYSKQALNNSRQRILGRKGKSLLSGEDIAITKAAIGMGFSMGQFIELKLLHLIPTRRVSEDYLFSLYCNIQASGQLISWLENTDASPPDYPNWRVWFKGAWRLIKGGNIERRLVLEEFRALRLARNLIGDTVAKSNTADSNSRPKL